MQGTIHPDYLFQLWSKYLQLIVLPLGLRDRGVVQPSHSYQQQMKGKDRKEQIPQDAWYEQRHFHLRDLFKENIVEYVKGNLTLIQQKVVTRMNDQIKPHKFIKLGIIKAHHSVECS